MPNGQQQNDDDYNNCKSSKKKPPANHAHTYNLHIWKRIQE